MTTYKIGGKDYELKMQRTDYPKLEVALVADDGERIDVFMQNISGVDGSPEVFYARDGLFWSEVGIEEYCGTIVPANDATKLTPDEWVNKTAKEVADVYVRTECNLPGSNECDSLIDLKEEVREWLEGQYKSLINEGLDEFVKGRLAAEKVVGDN